MRLKLLHKLQPLTLEADSLVIEDETGTPVFVAIQQDDRITYADIGERDFHALLKSLGISTNVSVQEIKPKPLQKMLYEK